MKERSNNPSNPINPMFFKYKATYRLQWLFALAFMVVVGVPSVFAQADKELKINKQFTGKHIVEVNHLHGDLEVRASNDNAVKVNIVFSVEAESEEEAKKVLDHLKMEFQESGDRLTINTKFDAKSWNTNNGITSIEFKDGATVRNLENIELFFTLYVPKLDQLILANKYDDIRIEDDLTTDLTVKLNSGVLQAENVKGDIVLEGKYSKMKMKNIAGNAKVNLYDTDAEIGNSKSVNISSKYSGVTLGDVTEITYDSYDDNVKIGTNSGALALTSKYSEFVIVGATKATIKSYDDVIDLGDIKGTIGIETMYSNFRVGSFTSGRISSNDDVFIMEGGEKADLKVNSKYSEFKLNKLNNIDFESSYDDQLDINQLGSLTTNSKYGEYTINKLEKNIAFVSMDDNLKVREVGSGFTGATLSGKYSTFELNLPSGLKYQLDVTLTHGKIIYPENNFEYGVHIEKGSSKEIKGKIKGASDGSPKIVVQEAYDCQVYLK